MVAKPAAGGGRWVEVSPQRLSRWIDGFVSRHGAPTVTHGGHDTSADETGVIDAAPVCVVASDGAVAEFYPPPGVGHPHGLDELVEVVGRPVRLGLLLARQASVAVGIADGDELVESKVDSSYVQGRTAAGGWSQHRFARRRENQAKAAAGTASQIVVRVLVPAVARLDAVVTGGDRRAVEAIMADPRLAPLAPLVSSRFLDVAEPRLAVLREAATRARAVVIRIREPGE